MTQLPNPLRHSWYVLFLLTLAYILSFIDRKILSLLVEPIQRDLKINDTQMSLLMGLSFAMFYVFLGIPIARLADTLNRQRIIMCAISLWSLMTAVCGLANNFTQLFLARIGVGVGETALSPAAFSMIADLFPKNKLAFAYSLYSMGIYIGSGLAFLMGGLVIGLVKAQEVWHLPLLGETYSWQIIFFLVGLPGLVFVALLAFIQEPVRQGTALQKTSFTQTWAFIFKNAGTYLNINLGSGFVSLSSYALASWVPSFFVRTRARRKNWLRIK